MDEKNMLVALCEYLGRSGVGVFMPEVWREGNFAIFLTGKTDVYKQYVNGDCILDVGFEIRARCPGESANDRLEVLKNFSVLSEYAEETLFPEPEIQVIIQKDAVKTKVYKDGSEEYHVKGSFRYLKRRGE